MKDTSTPEGRQKRLEELAEGYRESGNLSGLVRTIGGSIEDFRESDGFSHPDERLEERNNE